MKIKLFALLAIGFFLIGCENSITNNSTTEQDTVAEEMHNHLDTGETLVLNNGEKWKVDNNMMIYIQNMEEDIKLFASNNQKDYQTLADDLQKNVKLLTTNCTMSGMAHDELHKWLVPYITEVNELSEVKNETEANEIFFNIQDSFKTFNQYFQ
ncbi:MAG TPA: hypothetical protein VIN10_10340 [Bacteroidales bacterium]